MSGSTSEDAVYTICHVGLFQNYVSHVHVAGQVSPLDMLQTARGIPKAYSVLYGRYLKIGREPCTPLLLQCLHSGSPLHQLITRSSISHNVSKPPNSRHLVAAWLAVAQLVLFRLGFIGELGIGREEMKGLG